MIILGLFVWAVALPFNQTLSFWQYILSNTPQIFGTHLRRFYRVGRILTLVKQLYLNKTFPAINFQKKRRRLCVHNLNSGQGSHSFLLVFLFIIPPLHQASYELFGVLMKVDHVLGSRMSDFFLEQSQAISKV